jgi:uncharacterized protein YukE
MTTAESIYAVTQMPGDACGITRAGEQCGAVASAANEAARLLRRIDASWGSAMWCGPLATAFRERVTELPPDLERLTCSYEEVSRALAQYAKCLAATQEDLKRHRSIALDELDRADTARAQARSQRVGLDDMVRSLRSIADSFAQQPTEESLRESFRKAQRSYQERCDRFDKAVAGATDAQADLDHTLSVIGKMRADLDDERRQCVTKIRYASSIGIKNRPAWRVALDAVGGVAKGVAKAVIEGLGAFLEKVGTIASWVSAAALLVAVVAPFTAEVTVPLALLAADVATETTFLRGGLGLVADVLNGFWGAGYIRVERPSALDYGVAMFSVGSKALKGVPKPLGQLASKFRVLGPLARKIEPAVEEGRSIANAVEPVYRQLTLWEASPRAIDRALAWSGRIGRTIATGWRAGLNVVVRDEAPGVVKDVVVPIVERIRDAFTSGPWEITRPVPLLRPSRSVLPRFAPVLPGWTLLQGAAA